MIDSCVHTHSSFCDGKNTLSEMAEKAYSLGLKAMGFSGHSYVSIDDFGILPHKLDEYIAESNKLKSLYEGKMDIICGIELDKFSADTIDTSKFDYIIGSVHAITDNFGMYRVIDGSLDRFVGAAEEGFGGSFLSLCSGYYDQLCDFVLKTKPDIVGHFDLITKFNRGSKYFDEESSNYKNIALEAIDAILENDSVIEVNTGCIARGYRDKPYPADFIMKRILEKKGRVIITTDAHNVDMLVSNTEMAEDILRSVGFKAVCELSASGFYEREI